MANAFRIRTLLKCDECGGDSMRDPDQEYMDIGDRMEEDTARLFESITDHWVVMWNVRLALLRVDGEDSVSLRSDIMQVKKQSTLFIDWTTPHKQTAPWLVRDGSRRWRETYRSWSRGNDHDAPHERLQANAPNYPRIVKNLPLDCFRARLIEHFDVQWRLNKVVWPARIKVRSQSTYERQLFFALQAIAAAGFTRFR